MAVISFTEDLTRSGQLTAERKGALLEIPRRKYVRRFHAITDSVLDSSKTIRAHILCPKLGDQYVTPNEQDLLATCVDVRVNARPESPFSWYVEAEYDTARLVDATLENPLLMPAELSWDFLSYERARVRDVLGIPYVNSSQEAFDPPIMGEEKRPVLTVVRNEATFSAAFALQYQLVVNSDVFAGAAPGFARINKINGTRQREIGVTYYKVTYEVEFRREGFVRPVLDQGFRDKDKKQFLDPLNAQPYSGPTLMNGKGKRLSDATTTTSGVVGSADLLLNVTDGSTNFPPGSPLPHGRFEVRVDNEVMQVVGGFGTNNWNVTRGYAGTTAASHANGAAVKMEPYYLNFTEHFAVPFAPLALPVV